MVSPKVQLQIGCRERIKSSPQEIGGIFFYPNFTTEWTLRDVAPRGKSCFMGIRKIKLILFLVAYILQMCIINIMKKIYYTTLRTGEKLYVTPNQMDMIKRRERRLKENKVE